jgi:hypothetical protein
MRLFASGCGTCSAEVLLVNKGPLGKLPNGLGDVTLVAMPCDVVVALLLRVAAIGDLALCHVCTGRMMKPWEQTGFYTHIEQTRESRIICILSQSLSEITRHWKPVVACPKANRRSCIPVTSIGHIITHDDGTSGAGDEVLRSMVTLPPFRFSICGCVSTKRALAGSTSTNPRRVTGVMR